MPRRARDRAQQKASAVAAFHKMNETQTALTHLLCLQVIPRVTARCLTEFFMLPVFDRGTTRVIDGDMLTEVYHGGYHIYMVAKSGAIDKLGSKLTIVLGLLYTATHGRQLMPSFGLSDTKRDTIGDLLSIGAMGGLLFMAIKPSA